MTVKVKSIEFAKPHDCSGCVHCLMGNNESAVMLRKENCKHLSSASVTNRTLALLITYATHCRLSSVLPCPPLPVPAIVAFDSPAREYNS